MNDLLLLSKAQMRRIEPCFPLSHGVPRVDDRRVLSGILFVIRNGLRWRDAPAAYGPHKTIYNRFIRWSRLGVFNRIFAELAAGSDTSDQLMIDATHIKAHRTAASLLKKGLYPGCIGRSRGGLTTKLHAVCDGSGRPIRLVLTKGQTSDYKGAAMLVDTLPPAKAMLADRGYDAAWFRKALADRGITPCIPSKINRKVAISHDPSLHRQRHRIENMFGRLKDWRRIHTRYDRCAHTFLSAIAFAATFIFWLNQ
ncbi:MULTISPECIES: IS5 family transposase [unclassified Sphingomonas]|uniref:IS5 family transposase n=1 Tax=unclassified Sphingomonas TaxID=196159 RepID=UPI0012E14276|nr:MULTISPECIES: IS5 family transposase [unclassified Sphingomonas]